MCFSRWYLDFDTEKGFEAINEINFVRFIPYSVVQIIVNPYTKDYKAKKEYNKSGSKYNFHAQKYLRQTIFNSIYEQNF